MAVGKRVRMGWFGTKRKSVPDVATKCLGCGEAVFNNDLIKTQYVCPHCDKHLQIPVDLRIKTLCDPDSFKEFCKGILPLDPLKFMDNKPYKERLELAQKQTQCEEAITVGTASIEEHQVVIGLFNFGFIGGSMGSVVGEKILRATQKCIELHIPLIIFSSSGGARMHEGILSLMQMVKTGQGIAAMSQKRIPFISVLCDPTTGGVTASFAMLGDVILAEPEALIGFAGPRVIEQTIHETLPEGFQTSEFLLDKGLIDRIVHRGRMRKTLSRILSFFKEPNGSYYGSY
jgi:acetyl-CoA carboxylase carboxyl transferase subunit beta